MYIGPDEPCVDTETEIPALAGCDDLLTVDWDAACMGSGLGTSGLSGLTWSKPDDNGVVVWLGFGVGVVSVVLVSCKGVVEG